MIRKKQERKVRNFFKRILTKFWTYFVRKKCISCGKGLKVNFRSKVNWHTVLGNNVNFNGMNIMGCGQVVIGDNFHSGKGCSMITENHNYEGSEIPYDATLIPKDIYIKDNVWIGNQVLILGGVTIGEGAIIQAGSVVSSNIPDYSIAGGNPARVFKKRNIQHYLSLKKKGKFH